MSLTAVASGTTIGAQGGTRLYQTATPGIYMLEVDCSNLIVAGSNILVQVFTSVLPIFGGSAGQITMLEQLNRNAVNPQTSHLFTHPKQVGVIENAAAAAGNYAYWLLFQPTGTPVPFDWSLYLVD